MDYYFRGPIKPNNSSDYQYWEVAKFDPLSSGPPLEVYRVGRPDDSGKRHCTCPSPYLPCKHATLLDYWLQIPDHERYIYDSNDNMFYPTPFNPARLDLIEELFKAAERKRQT